MVSYLTVYLHHSPFMPCWISSRLDNKYLTQIKYLSFFIGQQVVNTVCTRLWTRGFWCHILNTAVILFSSYIIITGLILDGKLNILKSKCVLILILIFIVYLDNFPWFYTAILSNIFSNLFVSQWLIDTIYDRLSRCFIIVNRISEVLEKLNQFQFMCYTMLFSHHIISFVTATCILKSNVPLPSVWQSKTQKLTAKICTIEW